MRIAAEGVSLALRGRPVLEDVGFVARTGALTGLVGPNGAGKSTLLRALCGLLTPGSGRVLLDGSPLSVLPIDERARRIAYLPQDRSVHWALPVRTIVGLGRLPHRRLGAAEGPADLAAIDAAMAILDVSHLADRPVTELSGGERARALIARALAQETDVLIADEPAAGLDPAHQLQLFGALSGLADAGRTVVVALHDLSLAARFCASVALMRGGRMLAQGPPADVLTPLRIAEAYGITAWCGEAGGVPVVVPVAAAAPTNPAAVAGLDGS